MQLTEYQMLNGIVDELNNTDIDGIEEFANDAEIFGAIKTAKYIKKQLKLARDIDFSIVKYYLSRDFSG